MYGPFIPMAIYYVLAMGVYIPFKCLKAFKEGKAPAADVPSSKLRAAVIRSLWLLALFGLLVAYLVHIVIFAPWQPTVGEVTFGLVALAGFLGLRQVLKPWLRAAPKRIDSRLSPQTWEEVPMWGAVSVTAGITEEIIYRGVLFQIILHYVGQGWIAGLIVAIIFAVVHINQGIRTTTFIFLIGAVFQGLVVYSGSLYTAMIVHAAYDFIVGILALRERLATEPAAATYNRP